MRRQVLQKGGYEAGIGDADDMEDGERGLYEQPYEGRDGGAEVVPVEFAQMRQEGSSGSGATRLQYGIFGGSDAYIVVGAMEVTNP